MELIKRHYEKIILLALSIISVLTVWRMGEVIAKTKEVKESDLQINLPPADYVPLREWLKRYQKAMEIKDDKERENEINRLRENKDFADFLDNRKYDVTFLIKKTALTVGEAGYRDSRWADNYSDLMQVFKMAWCPECERGIPFNWLRDGGKCYICGTKLIAAPENPVKRRKRTAADVDGDGILNEDEKRYGLDEKYADDALLDKDYDGFSNLYEITISKTEPDDATSHPPLWLRLRYVTEDNVKLDIEITGVHTKTAKPEDKRTWIATIECKVRDLRTGEFDTQESDCKIGETLRFSGHEYVVSDIKLLDESDKSYAVVLEMVDGDKNDNSLLQKLTLISNQPTYSPDKGVVLEDIGAPLDQDKKRYYEFDGKKEEARFVLRPGDPIVLGVVSENARRRTKEVYRLESFDVNRKIAVLSRVSDDDPDNKIMVDQNGKEMIVTAKSGILDRNYWVTIPKEKAPNKETDGAGAKGNR